MIYYTARHWIEVRAFTSKCLVCIQPVKAYIDPLLVCWSIFPDLKKLFKMHICVSLPAAKYNVVKMATNIFNTRKKNNNNKTTTTVSKNYLTWVASFVPFIDVNNIWSTLKNSNYSLGEKSEENKYSWIFERLVGTKL